MSFTPAGWMSGSPVGTGNWAMKVADVFSFATSLQLVEVNQRLPSGPVVMKVGSHGTGYSVMAPDGVTFATASLMFSATQRLPSGPVVIPKGWVSGLGIEYSVIV